MSRTPGSGWGAGPMLWQKCPCCTKKKALYEGPGNGNLKSFRCTYCKEWFDDESLIKKRYPQ